MADDISSNESFNDEDLIPEFIKVSQRKAPSLSGLEDNIVTNAKIENVDGCKITSGSIHSDMIKGGSISLKKLDTSGKLAISPYVELALLVMILVVAIAGLVATSFTETSYYFVGIISITLFRFGMIIERF